MSRRRSVLNFESLRDKSVKIQFNKKNEERKKKLRSIRLLKLIKDDGRKEEVHENDPREKSLEDNKIKRATRTHNENTFLR